MKVTCKGSLYYNTDALSPWLEEASLWAFWPAEMKSIGSWIRVSNYTVELDVPAEFDPRDLQIQQAREELREMDARHELGRNALLDRISKLTALEGPSYPTMTPEGGTHGF